MTSETIQPFKNIDAYTLADGARRAETGFVIHDLRPQTRASTFVGRALTARIHYEPNRDIPLSEYGAGSLLDRAHPDDVVVLDGGGLPLTMLGDLAALVLSQRGAAAAVVNACIRDAEEIESIGLPVFAIGTAITTVAGHGRITNIGEPVHMYGACITSGDLIAGCRGGVVAVPWDRRNDVLKEAQRILESDRLVRDGINRGESIGQLWQAHKRLENASTDK